MTRLEECAVKLVKELVPECSGMEFRASIGDTSRAVEFFARIHGERRQCYDLADNGEIDEFQMEKLFDEFAQTVRKSPEYKKGQVNKIAFER